MFTIGSEVIKELNSVSRRVVFVARVVIKGYIGHWGAAFVEDAGELPVGTDQNGLRVCRCNRVNNVAAVDVDIVGGHCPVDGNCGGG